MKIPILYQDDDILVIDKPAGLPTHASESEDPYPGDALRVVQQQLGLSYLGMHQRLDAETSGVLLFATRRTANTALAAAFAGHTVVKVYLALVHGRPKHATGIVDAPIVRDKGERYRVTTTGDSRGQRAITHYRVLATAPDARYSLLELHPETGRSHQIRVHLASLGTPVVNDALYGGEREAPRAGRKEFHRADRGGFACLGLHAFSLTLPHPATGKPVTFTAPAPAIFMRVSQGLPELMLAATAQHLRSLSPTTDGLAELIELAVSRRAPLTADPQTTIYRLINAAADGLPGLAVDRYGDALIVQTYDVAERAEGDKISEAGPHLAPLASEWVDLLTAATHATTAYIKYRPKQASQVASEEAASRAPAQPAAGPALGTYVAHEDGLAYLVQPGEGWNPGLFPDMRELRGRVRAWARDGRVLNCFAYTCGFGVAAMAGGASRVLNLDFSKNVLERGQANYRANGFTPDPHDFVYGDAFDWLARFARRGEHFELVILDPPGFARTKTRRFSAEHDYGALAELAARTTAAGGLMVACCNVAELPWRAFRDRVLAGLTATGRTTQVTGVYHAPSLDFPTPAGQESHLKILAVRLA